jgi:quinol monooxygenase YgiN
MSDEKPAQHKPSTIATGAGLVTAIYTFTCPEVRQNDLVAALDRANTEAFAHLDGFVSASLHASLDQTRVINYTQWRSVAAFDAAQINPDVQKHLAEIMAVAESADPRLFEVRSVHQA